MTDTQNLEIRASVPIRYLPRMRTGELVEVSLSAIQLEGRIRKIVPAANSQSQTFEVRLDLPAHASALVAAGQLVSVDLPLTANAALTVPRDAVVRHRGERRLRRGTRKIAVRRPHRRSRSGGARRRRTGRGPDGRLNPGDRCTQTARQVDSCPMLEGRT
jgi:multidrug efflux pump subunit AcrA (membrane-fusion protein)